MPDFEFPVNVIVYTGVGVGGIFLFLMLITQMLYICKPNNVLIFSGRRHRLADGTERGFRVIFGGRGWRVPIIEEVDRMSLNLMEVRIAIRNAYSRGAIPLNIDAIANVKISGDQKKIGNAIERFLGRSPTEIATVAKETLEGHVRGVIATLTPEEINEDRLKFADSLKHESEQDLDKLGIHLDTLKILHVSDDSSYLDSIGRSAIAKVIKDAEIAESDAKRESEEVASQSVGRASVSNANVDAAIVRMQNELRRIKADLDSKVRSEEAKTAAAAREARAKAEQELQGIRTELQKLRLQADQVLPADANRKAREYEAQGRAASIRERGRATGQALDTLHAAWGEAGESAMAISLIEDLDKYLGAAARGVSKVRVGNVNLIDGGDGSTLSSYVAAYPAMLSAVFKGVADTTGIDIPQLVSGKKTSNGTRPADEKWKQTSQEGS